MLLPLLMVLLMTPTTRREMAHDASMGIGYLTTNKLKHYEEFTDLV